MKKYIPSIDEVMTKYKAIAKVERLKCGKPCEGTVWNTVKGSRNVCRAARLNLDSPITALTSGRSVFWPVHPDIWTHFDDMREFVASIGQSPWDSENFCGFTR